jgi:hypothetical protein
MGRRIQKKQPKPNKNIKLSPIPTRFDQRETEFINNSSARMGVSVSEIIRRCVRLAERYPQLAFTAPHSIIGGSNFSRFDPQERNRENIQKLP